MPSELSQSPTCLNCGSPMVDEYCAHCGQPYRGGERLTIRGLLAEFGHKFLNLERGLLRTARDLTIRPGAMMRDYVTGKRKTYTNPFTYLVFGTAINLIVYRLTGTRERALEAVRGKFAQDPNMGAEMARSMSEQMELLVDQNLYLMLLMAIPFTLLLRLFFWRFGATFAEIAVFPLYTFGHVALLGTLGSLAAIGRPYPMTAMAIFSFGVYLVYTGVAAWGFFDRGLWPAIKTSVALAVSYVVTIGSASILMVVVLLTTSGNRVDSLTSGAWSLPDAVEQGAVEVARGLLGDGTDPNQTRDLTPLHLAARDGSPEMVDLLLGHGADHDHELMGQMVERGAPLDAFRPEKRAATALLQAVTGDDLEALEILLEAGADPTVTDYKGRSALDLAETQEIRQRLQTALAKRGGR